MVETCTSINSSFSYKSYRVLLAKKIHMSKQQQEPSNLLQKLHTSKACRKALSAISGVSSVS